MAEPLPIPVRVSPRPAQPAPDEARGPAGRSLGTYRPAVHDVRMPRRADDHGCRRLLTWVHARYLNNAPARLRAEACPALRIDLAV